MKTRGDRVTKQRSREDARRLISEFNAVAATRPIGQQHTHTARHVVTKFLYGPDDTGRVRYVEKSYATHTTC